MTSSDNQLPEDTREEERLAALLSAADQGVAPPDQAFLARLRKQSTKAFLASSAKQKQLSGRRWAVVVVAAAAACMMLAVGIWMLYRGGSEESYAVKSLKPVMLAKHVPPATSILDHAVGGQPTTPVPPWVRERMEERIGNNDGVPVLDPPPVEFPPTNKPPFAGYPNIPGADLNKPETKPSGVLVIGKHPVPTSRGPGDPNQVNNFRQFNGPIAKGFSDGTVSIVTDTSKTSPISKVEFDEWAWDHAVEAKLLQLERTRELVRSGALQPEVQRELEKELAKLKASKPKDGKGPQVWKRDQQSPTFARVNLGGGNSLELVSLHVTTTIEGPRARTVVDHIFRNPHDRQLEGTFEYPLPTGASTSYFAMFLGNSRNTVPDRFVQRGNLPALSAEGAASLTPQEIVASVSTEDWGKLQEARVVGKERALEVYEEIVRGRIDPALLEHAGGNTFRGRVFPIPAKGYNRVLIAYEELLPISEGKDLYKFPLPDCDLKELQFTLKARTADHKDVTFKPDDAWKAESKGALLFTRSWTKKGPGGEVIFAATPAKLQAQVIAGQVSRDAQRSTGAGAETYVYARIRPELKSVKSSSFARHAVFMLDTSMSEHPDRFNVNMKLLKKILETDTNIQQFNILAFNVGAAWVAPAGWLKNDKAGREQAFNRLDGIVLEGATDIGAALDKLARPGFEVKAGTPIEVFLLSDGQITWGDPDVSSLVARFESKSTCPTRFNCYRTGIGADNLELFEGLTRRGGGIFNCFTEKDQYAAAKAHSSQCLQIQNVRFVGGPAASDVLVAGRKAAVYPGGEVIVACKLAKAGKTQLVVEGLYRGEKYAEEFSIDATTTGELAPRGWAEIAVASLLALNDPKLDSLVTAYCQQFGIGSRVASFLVLENDSDYKRLKLEDERGKAVPGGDVGAFLDKAWQSMGKLISPKKSFERFLSQVDKRVKLLDGKQGEHVQKLLALLSDKDFELPESKLAGAILNKKDVPAEYLKSIAANRRNPENYLTEATRRVKAKDRDGAVRTLSTIVEDNPGQGEALRLVGYRLLDLEQPTQAIRLFDRVQRQRPFEPHSYLDLARSLEESGKYGLAAVQYEIVLAGTWDARFHESLKTITRENYARMMRQAVREKAVAGDLGNVFGDRIEKMDPSQFQADLRVSINWNTDNTDVDLWVFEPDKTKCFYQNRNTKNGGQLTEDVTRGYGPERFVAKKAMKGEYTIVLDYFSENPNLLAGETHVNVIITMHAGTDKEEVTRKTVILKKNKQQVEVCKVKF